tara:strand:- start:1070 stop:1708 length:639 start_codon:yes stop_codon:yes gene_type:complete
MWKKISIQLILLSIVFFSIYYVYKFYFKTKDNIKIDQSDIVQNKSSDDINNNKSNFDIDDKTNADVDNQNNLIKNLSYFSKDNLGNEYIIESKYSELNLDNVDIISMESVSAKIIMANSKPIYVTSNFAKYNNENYETTFTDNVLIVYLDNKIRCEKFYISIENNFANVTDNVIYENPNGKLIADTIEIDLITKNSKIFMIDKSKKVMVLNK